MIKKILLTTTILSIAYLYQNRYIKKRKYIISDKKISQSFNGFKIIQLSDIHCGKLGFSDQIFLKNIKKEKADIIVITGDILDSYRNDSACAYNILSQISDIAPTYFISGNHEVRLSKEYTELKEFLKKLDINHLENKSQPISRDRESINLVGIEDFNFFRKNDKKNYYANYRNILKNNFQENKYNILLAHRPEKFFMYSELGYDLIFSGHAHGGQWNIPLLGRIFSPSQGLFPKFTHGIYEEKNSKMIVSQGLGNSSFSTRINNFLEYIVVELKNE